MLLDTHVSSFERSKINYSNIFYEALSISKFFVRRSGKFLMVQEIFDTIDNSINTTPPNRIIIFRKEGGSIYLFILITVNQSNHSRVSFQL